MIKAVIFDMDGLMVDTEKLLMRFWIESAKSFGFDMNKEHVLSIRSLAAPLSEKKLKGIFGEEFDYKNVRLNRIKIMNEYIDKNGIEMKKGLVELLEYLKENNIMRAVATQTDRQRTKRYLSSIGVYDYFQKFICGDMIKNGKPFPDIYITACKELNVSPKETIALEDSPNGILSASRANVNPVMIPDLSEPDEETKKLLFAKCKSLDEVINILKR